MARAAIQEGISFNRHCTAILMPYTLILTPAAEHDTDGTKDTQANAYQVLLSELLIEQAGCYEAVCYESDCPKRCDNGRRCESISV